MSTRREAAELISYFVGKYGILALTGGSLFVIVHVVIDLPLHPAYVVVDIFSVILLALIISYPEVIDPDILPTLALKMRLIASISVLGILFAGLLLGSMSTAVFLVELITGLFVAAQASQQLSNEMGSSMKKVPPSSSLS